MIFSKKVSVTKNKMKTTFFSILFVIVFAVKAFGAPVANAGSDMTVFVGEAIRLDGSASTGYTTQSQADGTWSILWQTGDGFDAENIIKCPHVYTAPGTYTATLTVKDNNGVSSTSTVTITAIEIAEAAAENIQILVDTGNPETNKINLQSAINRAAGNSSVNEIRVPAGFVFNDAIIMPPRSSPNYVTIRAADLSVLPAGVRVTAADKPKLFRMNMRGASSSGYNNAVEFSRGANYYRIIGMEIRHMQSEINTEMMGAVFNTSNWTTDAGNIIVDRCLFDGNGFETRRALALNTRTTSLLNSSVLNIYARGVETKAVANWSGAGPLAVLNSRLEAASINVLIGGSNTYSFDEVLDGFVFRGNHVWKNPAWAGVYAVKNLFELKQGYNTVAAGNIFENNYMDAQAGDAILIKSMTDEGCAYCEVRNLDFRNNKILNVRAGFNVTNMQAFNTPYPPYASYIRFANNFWQQTKMRGNLSNGAKYFEIIHNTFTTVDNTETPVSSFISFDYGSTGVPAGYKAPGFKLLNNLVYDAYYYNYSLISDTANGTGALNGYLAPDWDMRRNVIGNVNPSWHPVDNFYPTTVKTEFVDYAGGNFNLKPTSVYRGAGTDGTDIGANMAVVNAATASALSGNWNPQTSTLALKGKITKGGTPVGGVLVTLSGSSSAVTVTDNFGNYTFNVESGGSYTVSPAKTGDVSGIDSLDANLVQRYLVGLANLSPSQLAASDVNNNGVVNSVDVTRIQEYLNGIHSSNNIGEWRFSPAARNYNNIVNNTNAENYEAILIGEVSGNWNSANFTPKYLQTEETRSSESLDIFKKVGFEQNSNGLRFKSSKPLADRQSESLTELEIPVSLPNITASQGTVIKIPVSVGDLTGTDIEAFDFSITYDSTVLRPAAVMATTEATLSQNCLSMANSPVNGKLILSVSCPNPHINSGAGTLINLYFDVIGAGNQQTPLLFTDPVNNLNTFQFNDATPQARTAAGLFTVVGPTVTRVIAGGRVLTQNGRGASKATVSITDSSGNRRYALTNTFGYYQFTEVAAGKIYTVNVSDKRLDFTPPYQIRKIVEDTLDINFISTR